MSWMVEGLQMTMFIPLEMPPSFISLESCPVKPMIVTWFLLSFTFSKDLILLDISIPFRYGISKSVKINLISFLWDLNKSSPY